MVLFSGPRMQTIRHRNPDRNPPVWLSGNASMKVCESNFKLYATEFYFPNTLYRMPIEFLHGQ